ncbi:amidase signature enzyme [Dothidotthia symphoricarpi CBS 119687]|uniref:Amidase signature enzyme n=1 Tax=Dothidotthia symphoricarpi CBS 119687 TaxID=1392245 RepID=A0A6A6AIK0_9PLEO|nr:amidase signature enzyme [Dothidotthia symphoricarpi CBS 119687]KAF2131386.1 amidase signature enzyme [Dothidotthia symphoricarpi CBS 119687]
MVLISSETLRGCFVALLVSFASANPVQPADISIVEATVEGLQNALTSGRINAVQLLAKHLHRIARYSRRGPQLNAIPVLNPSLFDDAQASDEYRSSTAGETRSLLEGIPFTAKDSYMLAGVPVAAGSPAFQNLTASVDAFTISRIKKAGGIAIGKTNMPPMANGGMQRGLYGRADSPYNRDFLAAAMGSGSSNGCGSSTSASMAVFGLAEETVSSGRSPASNNGLVAYTPSRGILSMRGNWPLQPSADVVVPHTRTVKDMLALLDILVVTDNDTTSDFWRGQPFVTLPHVESIRPASYFALADPHSLKGKRIGVPRMFIGEHDPAAVPVYIRDSVRELWNDARATLESLGATVQEVDFPAVTNYDVPPIQNEVGTKWPIPSYFNGSSGPNYTEIVAYAWDDFLHMVNDTTSVTRLVDVDPDLIFPQIPGTLPDRWSNTFSNSSGSYDGYVAAAAIRGGRSIFDMPGLGTYLHMLEDRRKRDLEAWMDQLGLDLVVWPSAGDVGPEDAETNSTAAELAWRNGVARSNGNAAIRQLGIPTVSVVMGVMNDTRMPVDLTFASKAYHDNALLSYGYAFEQAQGKRPVPSRTPTLDSDIIHGKVSKRTRANTQAPKLHAEAMRVDKSTIVVSGYVSHNTSTEVEVFVDGINVGYVARGNNEWSIETDVSPWKASEFPQINDPDQRLAMIVVVASALNGRSDGKLLFA